MITLQTLRERKAAGQPFSCLTCYDATFAAAMAAAQIDSILIGDSLGMVVQGHDSTLPVTVADIAYHTAAVRRANQYSLLMADMPFMSYATPERALDAALPLMQAGAHVVKLEGGAWLADTVRLLAQSGVPSCIHLGLTPQSVNVFGGYKVQGKTRDASDRLLHDVQAVVEAGAALLVLECVPVALAQQVQTRFEVPVIGIGAGIHCDGQVLVMHDMLGVTQGKKARFVHDFLSDPANDSHSIEGAFRAFHAAVVSRSYPQPQHSFNIKIK